MKREQLDHIAKKFATVPNDFTVHPALKRTLGQRAKSAEDGMADWAIGEALAFGTLLMENYHVRLSGQDVERGTFSHRHHVVHDLNEDGKQFRMLTDLAPGQAP